MAATYARLLARRGVPLLLVAVLAGSLAACKGKTTKLPDTTVTVNRPSSSSRTSSKPSSKPPSSSSSPPAATLRKTTLKVHPGPAQRQLPGRCNDLLPRSQVVKAIGKDPGGSDEFVVGRPDPSISRLGYINCKYGGSDATPNVLIQVSLYSSTAKATARIAPNVRDYTDNGAKATKVSVGGAAGTVLTGGSGGGYPPEILLATGARTVVVSIKAGVVPAANLQQALINAAALAAVRTTGR